MTQSEEFPAEPIPAQPTEPVEPTESVQASEPAQSVPPVQPSGPAQSVPPAQPSGEPAPMWGQPADPAAAQAGYVLAATAAVTAGPVLSPEEQAAAAAKKAKRRTLFAKSAILAVPAVALVSLLVVTGIQASSLSTKTTAASTAAKSANAASGLVAQLHAAESAGEASILVDAGCVAAESQATANLENKVEATSNALGTAENGTSLTAFVTAVNNYINSLQAMSTNLQQDAALSSRASVKTALGAVTGDLGVAISAMQSVLAGSLTTSAQNNLNTVLNRMDGDATAVDTMCGGDTLNGSSNSTSGSGSTSA